MPMNPISTRLLSQQLICPRFDSPAELVSHFGAMQAQEYRMMRWAVSMRTRKPSMDAFKRDFDEGRIIRLHLLRGTWQLVSGDDYWWMLDLCADKAARVIKGWMSANRISIPEDELRSVREILVRKTAEIRSATKDNYVDALAAEGITMDDHRLSYHIRMAELDGILCSGDLHPSKATYSLSAAKVGPRPERIDRDESLRSLTRKYFQSHSPATFEDFQWWSGLNGGDCRKGMDMLGDELRTERLGGRKFHIHESCRTRGFRKGCALLIPPYDEYLIGYKSRDIVLDPELSHRAHNNSGIFQPVVTLDGRICANWKPSEKKMVIDCFPGTVLPEGIVDDQWKSYTKWRSR